MKRAGPTTDQIYPNNINNRGEVIGHRLVHDAFRWTAREGLQSLGSLQNSGNYSEAFGINRFGTIVGIGVPVDIVRRAFVWDKTHGMRDLNELIDPTSQWQASIIYS